MRSARTQNSRKHREREREREREEKKRREVSMGAVMLLTRCQDTQKTMGMCEEMLSLVGSRPDKGANNSNEKQVMTMMMAAIVEKKDG